MKLMLCPDCTNLVPLSRRRMRKCRCGRVRGKYLKDGWHAEVYGDPIMIGMDTNELHEVARNRGLHERENSAAPPSHLAAWVMPRDTPRVERKD